MNRDELKLAFDDYKEIKNKKIDETILKTLNEFEWFNETEFIQRYNFNCHDEIINYNVKITENREKIKELLIASVIHQKQNLCKQCLDDLFLSSYSFPPLPT